MRLPIATLAALALLTGCGTADDTGSSDAPKVSAEAKLVQDRYGDCLTKLGATLDKDGPRWVSFDTKDGRYLVIGVAKVNGNYVTVPKDDGRSAALLKSVGC